MTSVEPGTVKRRRRGADLERALLTAAWDELTEAGFAKLTMESVADRAKTGVAVLYRRWTDKSDLVLAAIRHYRDLNPVVIPDTGDLREDMLALLGDINTRREDIATLVGATFAGSMTAPDSPRRTSCSACSATAHDGPTRCSTGRTSAAR